MSFKGLAVAMSALALSSGVFGQYATRGDPADSHAGAAPMTYDSVFRGYRGFTDEKVVSWRATNDLVQKLGGWQAFARDKVPDIPPVTAPADESMPKAPETTPAQQPASKAPVTSSPPAKPGGHGGHR